MSVYSALPGVDYIVMFSDTGVSVYSVHPGGVSTDLGRNLPSFLPDQVHGALTTAFNWVAKVKKNHPFIHTYSR